MDGIEDMETNEKAKAVSEIDGSGDKTAAEGLVMTREQVHEPVPYLVEGRLGPLNDLLQNVSDS